MQKKWLDKTNQEGKWNMLSEIMIAILIISGYIILKSSVNKIARKMVFS